MDYKLVKYYEMLHLFTDILFIGNCKDLFNTENGILQLCMEKKAS